MDMEEIENFIEDELSIQQAGYASTDGFLQFREHAVHGMRMYGDSFMKKLADALHEARLRDSLRILRYWHSECEQLAMMYRMFLARHLACNVT